MEPRHAEEKHGFRPVGQNGAGSSCLADLVLEPDSVQRLRLLHTHNSMLGGGGVRSPPQSGGLVCPVTFNTAVHIYQDSQRGGAGQEIAMPCACP